MAYPDHRGALLDSYGISTEQLGDPTPCASYDVSALVDHTVEAGRRAAALGRGQAPSAGDAYPHVELSDAPVQLRQAAEEAAKAWGEDSRFWSTVTMPWGEECTGSALVDMYLAELAAHAWDLARATGQLDRLDGSLAVPALSGARTMMKAEYRDAVGPGSPFGAEVPLSPDADDWERFVAFTGRDPKAPVG